MTRNAIGKVPLPDDDETPSTRDRRHLTDTLRGVGREECPSMPACQLEFMRSLNERDERWETRLNGIEQQVSEVRSILLQWVGSKGIRNSDSTPAERGTLDISAGSVKMRGKAWTVAAVVLLLAAVLGSIAGGAYVLGEWGRPATTTK